MNNKEIAYLLEAARNKHHMKVATLASLCDVDDSVAKKWIDGISLPDKRAAQRIEAIFGFEKNSFIAKCDYASIYSRAVSYIRQMPLDEVDELLKKWDSEKSEAEVRALEMLKEIEPKMRFDRCEQTPLKTLRKKAGMTQMDAAKALGISDAAVAQWETGETFPSSKRLTEIAKLYGCTIDELLGG